MILIDEIKRIKSTEKEARKFGIQVGLVVMIIALILFTSGKGNSHYFFIAGGVLIVLGQFFPQLLILPNKLWMSFGVVLGYFSSRIILFVLFYFILTPIGIAAKIFGKNFLDKKINIERKSYWNTRNNLYNKSQTEKQF
jgi:hypothetical protein